MKTYRRLISFALITALLSSGLPLFQGEDASRDNRVDLKDVILLVKNFSGTAENPAGFEGSLKNMVSALQVTAGMKTVIKNSDESNTGSSFAGLDLTFLKSVSTLATEVGNAFYLNERPICFKSVTTTPSSPPPKFS